MGRGRAPLLLALCAGLLLAVILIARRPRPSPEPASATVPLAPGIQPPGPRPVPASPSALFDALRRGTAQQDRSIRVAAARTLRDALIADASLLAEMERMLRDLSAPVTLRQAVAAVLGSLPGGAGKAVLLRALKDGGAAGLERTVLLALGIRALEDGEIFERDDQPYAMEVAPGLVVYVQGPLEDGEARAELGRQLAASPSAEVRRAAARVLRDSTAFPEVRRDLLGRLGTERDAETTGEVGAALCAWTRSPRADPSERTTVVSRVFDLVPGSEEVVRFRLTGPLAGAPLGREGLQRLQGLAAHGEADTRLFALDVMGRRLGISPADDEAVLPALARAVSADPDNDVREIAALSLARAAGRPQALQALRSALRQDADWEVRAAAARSLAGAGAGAREALQEASRNDPHPDVRAAALRSLR